MKFCNCCTSNLILFHFRPKVLFVLYVKGEYKYLSRDVYYLGLNTKESDFVLSSAVTSIKVTILPLT